MNEMAGVFAGIIHGKTIELIDAPGLPDGQAVSVVVQPLESIENHLPPGEGLRRAFGSWAEDASELDKFLEEIRHRRKRNRLEIDP